MKGLIAAFVLLTTLGAPAVAHAEQGPGYGGDANGLEVSWQENRDQALPAPPPVPSDENAGTDSGPVTDPDRLSFIGDTATLEVGGIGFRGLSEVVIRFGSEQPVAVRADQAGSVAAGFPGTHSADPGTTVVAVGRSPSGATRTLVGSVPPLPHGTNLMGMVTWLIVAPVVLIVAAAIMRHRAGRDASTALLAAAPTGQPITVYPMPAPTRPPVVMAPPPGRVWWPPTPPDALPTLPPQGPPIRL